jgi:hypothetical protein
LAQQNRAHIETPRSDDGHRAFGQFWGS